MYVRALVLALLLALTALFPIGAGAAPAPPPGNSGAAQTCQKGGYTQLEGVSGGQVVRFTSMQDCLTYAAHGGVLQSRVQATLVKTVTYCDPCVGLGGRGFFYTLVGTGLKPGTPVLLDYQNFGDYAGFGIIYTVVGQLIGTVADDGTFEYAGASLCGYAIGLTATATTAANTTISSGNPTPPCS